MTVPVRRYLNMDPQQNTKINFLYRFSLGVRRSGKMSEKKKQEPRGLYGGVPFPGPKIVQNEHFHIILLTKRGPPNKNQFLVYRDFLKM